MEDLGNPVFFFAGALLFGVAWWLLFSEADRWNSRSYGPAVYHLHDPGMMLAVPALFLGLASSEALTVWTLRRLLGDRYADYTRFENLSYEYDTERVARPLLVGTSLLALVAVALLVSWHVVFRNNEIVFHSWCGLGTTSKLYTEIKDIRTAPQLRAPSGALVDRRDYVIEFADGSTWSTKYAPATLDPQRKQQLVSFIAKQAQQPIRELKVLE